MYGYAPCQSEFLQWLALWSVGKKEEVIFHLFNDSVVSALVGNLEVLVMYIADGDGIAAKVHHKLAVTQNWCEITFLSS